MHILLILHILHILQIQTPLVNGHTLFKIYHIIGVSGSPLYLSLLLLGGTGSVYCSTGWYLVVLGQNRAVLVTNVICFQKIYGLHAVNHQIIQ